MTPPCTPTTPRLSSHPVLWIWVLMAGVPWVPLWDQDPTLFPWGGGTWELPSQCLRVLPSLQALRAHLFPIEQLPSLPCTCQLT